ncbi:MAG: hypothetical protein WKG07_08015 [Hymenobacter sp.]
MTSKKGSVTEQRQLGTRQFTTVTDKHGSHDVHDKKGNFITPAKVEVENKVGLSWRGIGGEIGQSQQIDGNLMSSDSKTFKEVGTSHNGASETLSVETDESGNVTRKSETAITVGAKLILGVELENFIGKISLK